MNKAFCFAGALLVCLKKRARMSCVRERTNWNEIVLVWQRGGRKKTRGKKEVVERGCGRA